MPVDGNASSASKFICCTMPVCVSCVERKIQNNAREENLEPSWACARAQPTQPARITLPSKSLVKCFVYTSTFISSQGTFLCVCVASRRQNCIATSSIHGTTTTSANSFMNKYHLSRLSPTLSLAFFPFSLRFCT